jgi:hypothetical protein
MFFGLFFTWTPEFMAPDCWACKEGEEERRTEERWEEGRAVERILSSDGHIPLYPTSWRVSKQLCHILIVRLEREQLRVIECFGDEIGMF